MPERLRQSGFKEIAGYFLEALEPLSFIGAQLLWVAQPTLGLFIERERVSKWAAVLEDPQALAQLRQGLFMEDESNG